MKQWWGIIYKDQHIELKDYCNGDFTKMRLAYKNEAEIDFVIEPFPAECFEDAKIWVMDCMKSSLEEYEKMMKKFNANSKKSVDRKKKPV